MLSGKHTEVTRNRLGIFTDEGKKEANLLSKLYKEKQTIENILVHTIQPPPGRVSFEEAVINGKKNGKFIPLTTKTFGPSWFLFRARLVLMISQRSTHWFELQIEIPTQWKDEEVHLLWDCECEALLWSEDGTPLQAFLGSKGEDRRAEFILFNKATGEMACTEMFGTGGWGGFGPRPAEEDKKYTLSIHQIAVFDRLAYELLEKFTIIKDIAKVFPEDSLRANQALFTANQIMNVFELNERSSWNKCLELANKFLSQKNGESQHNISAVGHSWLWPYAETKRKCARSWSTQLRICERNPNYKFACSQAQQYEWVKELYPKLWTQIKEMVKKGQFVPVGGTWVEMDCNIPSGESLVRQFLFGQRFFEKEFGSKCKEFWLPDTFGYAAQLPQIIKGAAIEYFLTQKLSWCQFNKFPHHTFYWEGLDGTSVLTHFPPTDTYNAQSNVKELVFHVKNFKDKERCNESLMVYGHGDGGGGPLMKMVDELNYMKDCDGLPKIEMRSPFEFFERCKKDAKDLAVWVGELYFEYHRGTYTTQAKNKLGNRRAEFLLRDIEFLSAVSQKLNSFGYPSDELSKIWKLVLLNQFHDVIPGSSITEVYKDSSEHYEYIQKSGNQLLENALASFSQESGSNKFSVFNTLPWERYEVVEVPKGTTGSTSLSCHGNELVVVKAPSMGYSPLQPQSVNEAVASISQRDGKVILENPHIKAEFIGNALISLIYKKNNREVIEKGKTANQFIIYDDVPMYWDAWDVDVYHLEKRVDINGKNSSVKILETGPLRVSFEITTDLTSTSKLKQVVSLNSVTPRLDFSCEVDWNESHKFLKVEFPVAVRAMHATYEIQFGHWQRPTHWNTSWDVAKFEVCGHKWADLSESGFGVSLLNDCKYGHATHGNVIRLSLLRSPKCPDPTADIGHHTFRYALYPHTGTFQESGVIQEAYNFNEPLLIRPVPVPEPRSFFSVNNRAVIIETVKKAEDSDDVIVRLYESHGGRCDVTLTSSLPVKGVTRCNLLEEDEKGDDAAALQWNNNSVTFSVKPFQIITFKLHF